MVSGPSGGCGTKRWTKPGKVSVRFKPTYKDYLKVMICKCPFRHLIIASLNFKSQPLCFYGPLVVTDRCDPR